LRIPGAKQPKEIFQSNYIINLIQPRNPPSLAVVMDIGLCLVKFEKFAVAKPHIVRKAAAYGGG
jgi:hypothetical protein